MLIAAEGIKQIDGTAGKERTSVIYKMTTLPAIVLRYWVVYWDERMLITSIGTTVLGKVKICRADWYEITQY